MRNSVIGLSLVLGLAAGAASANPPLRDVEYVTEGLIAAGMAIEISEKCDSISARLLRGFNLLNDLEKHALGLGYSQAEVDAYVDDRTEKARLEGIARQRLAELGASADNPQSYCAVGQQQIAAGTAVGRLLR